MTAACCLGATAAHADWDVEISAARFTRLGEAPALDVASLVAPEPVPDTQQRTNINRRLVNTPPEPPLSERRALAKAHEAAGWTQFAEERLQDGDVLFRLGRARTHLIMNFSKVTAIATRSRYSHTAVFRWHDGVPEVIDITDSGLRIQQFAVWMREVDENAFAVRRLKPMYRDRIPQVLAFLDAQSDLRPEFDFKFEPDNGRYYCNELTETAFRSAGLPLSEAIPGTELPGAADVPIWTWLIKTVGGVELSTPMYVAGNETYGMFGSDKLEPVYSTADDGIPVQIAAVVAALPAR